MVWSLRSPTVCYPQAGEPEKPMVWFNSMTKSWELSGFWVKFQNARTWEGGAPISECKTRWMSQLKKTARESILPLPILFRLDPQRISWCPTHWWVRIFAQSTKVNADFFQNMLTYTPRKKPLSSWLGIPKPSQVTHKINHDISPSQKIFFLSLAQFFQSLCIQLKHFMLNIFLETS